MSFNKFVLGPCFNPETRQQQDRLEWFLCFCDGAVARTLPKLRSEATAMVCWDQFRKDPWGSLHSDLLQLLFLADQVVT